MQEHFNFWLEELAQHKGKEFGDEWYRHVLAMHVHHFLRLKEEMESSVLLAQQKKGHTHVDTDNEVAQVMRICRERKLHHFEGGRDLGFHSTDSFATGYTRLGFEGKLAEFVKNSSRVGHNLDEELSFPTNAADPATYLCTPMHYEDGLLVFPSQTETVLDSV